MIGHWYIPLLVPAAVEPAAPQRQMLPGPDESSAPPHRPGYIDDESLLQIAVALITTGVLNG